MALRQRSDSPLVKRCVRTKQLQTDQGRFRSLSCQRHDASYFCFTPHSQELSEQLLVNAGASLKGSLRARQIKATEELALISQETGKAVSISTAEDADDMLLVLPPEEKRDFS